MNPTSANPALTAELTRLAQLQVDNARNQYQLSLDYSEESLTWLDAAITQFHADDADDAVSDNTLLGLGAYVGETIRRLLGGFWVQDERGVALLQSVGGGDLSASPISWVQQRFANGAELIAHRFLDLKQQVEQMGIGQTAAAPAPVAEPPAPVTAEEKELLARAPFMVFVLVAAADGKVDAKELAGFQEMISDLQDMNPLLGQALAEMQSQLERFAHEVSGWNPAEDLQRVAALLDAHYPSDAEAFKRSLVAIAIKVANSSGGFLGLGSKISKKEKRAIAAIAIALGLAGEETSADAPVEATAEDAVPLEKADVIDMVLHPDAEGKVGLVIMDVYEIADAQRRSALFRQKVINYCNEVIAGHFKPEYPDLKTSDFYIKVISHDPPTPEMYQLAVVGSKSRPEERMTVRFEQADGQPWPGQRMPLEDASQIPPLSARLKEFLDAEFKFAFQTIRDNCFQGFAAALENGEKQKFLLGVGSEEQVPFAQDIAAKASADVTCFIVISDATLTGPDGRPQDALLGRVSERGRPKGILVALKYTPRSSLKQPSVIGEPYVVGECENDLEVRTTAGG